MTKKNTISREDAETMMIALDQVSQTIDVMNMIVTRLKNRMAGALNVDTNHRTGDSKSGDNRNHHNQLLEGLDNGSLH